MRYTVLVIEDMQIIRQGLVNLLAENDSFDIKEASNGIEGIEIVQNENIDFILVDIKMPKCDGLEFLKTIKEMKLQIPSVIISGYSDFEYAEKAIRYGVSGYLLKPIEEEKFHTMIRKLKSEVDTQRSQSTILSNYQKIQLAIEKQKDDKNLLKQLFSEEKVYFKDNYYTVALILFPIEKKEISVRSLNHFYETHSEFSPRIVEHPIFNNHYMLVFNSKEHNYTRTYEDIKKLFVYFQNKQIEKICISISDTDHYLNKEVYLQAEKASFLRFLMNKNQVFRYKNDQAEKIIINESHLKLLQKAIKNNDFTKVDELLIVLFSYHERVLHPRKLFYRLLENLRKIGIENYGLLFSNDLSPLKINNDYLSLRLNQQDLIQSLSNIFSEYQFIDGNFNNNSDNLISKVKNYITNHYGEEIVVKQLAELFNINYSYLSSTFKKEEGQSIVSYIKKIRVEKAKTLLIETNSSINTISEIVGYQDVQYFYKVFKQCTDQTPLKFRNSKIMTIKD